MESNQPQILKTEFENARILDFRDPSTPTSKKIVLICNHASNSLPEGYDWTDNDRQNFATEYWAWDEAALETATYLASELKCVLVHSLYSRLLTDVDRDIPSEDLFRKSVNGREVELNQGMTEEEQINRITKYHISYYRALREVSEKIDPDIVFAIHTFPPSLEEAQLTNGDVTFEIGIEYADSEALGKKMFQTLIGKDYNVGLNRPSPGAFMNALNTVIRATYPVSRQGVCLDVRNDLLQDDDKALKIKKDILEAIRHVCLEGEKENQEKSVPA